MALLARNDGVFSKKRKMREIVIVGDLLAPSVFIVALLAVLAQLALMCIVLLVAGDAGGSELVVIEIAGVASLALQGRMGAVEREFGLRVIEVDGLPLRAVVAGLALRAVLALMDVLQLMARRASQRHAFVFFIGVAGGAGHLLMPTRQREFGLRVVEGPHLGPAFLTVAGLAVIAEAALMLVRGFVAADALAGRVPELHIRLVAGVASGLFVAANKREIRQGVIEGFLVELHNVRCPALMVRMAAVAVGLGSVRPLAMQAASQIPVTRNVLVAGKAKLSLRTFRERLMAIGAVLFELCMSLHKLARHDEFFKDVLSARRPGRNHDKERHEPQA